MLFSTTDRIVISGAERRVHHMAGVISASAVVGKKVGSSVGFGAKSTFGLDNRGMSETIDKAFSIALGKLKKRGEELGADAVISVRLASTNMTENAVEVVLYGTAVILDRL